MTFSAAVNNLRNGMACKRPSWKGFIKRVDVTPTVDSFSSSATYSVGDYVQNDGSYYRCVSAASTAGSWNADNWTEVLLADIPATEYDLVFVYSDGTTEATYRFDANATNNVKKDGTTVKKGSATATEFEDYAPLTQFLFEAILQDDWEVGNTSDFEAVASGDNEF